MKQINLLLDVTGEFSNIYLINNEKIIDIFTNQNQKDLSIKLNEYVNEILNKNKLKISDINNIYLVYGPGKFSAMRIVSVFVKTIKLLYKNINLFILDRFNFLNKNKSLVLINADGNKYFLSIINDNKFELKPMIISKEKINDILKIKNDYYEKIIDYRNDNDNIIQNLKKFIKVDENFELIYLKDIIDGK